MSLMIEVSITPLDKGESVAEYVAGAIDIIDKSGLAYRLGPMGTCIEGEWDSVMAVVRECIEHTALTSRRVTFSIKGDYRPGKNGRLEAKVSSVENRLGRPLRK